MQSLSFTPGRAFLSVDSPIVPWTVVFEDEGHDVLKLPNRVQCYEKITTFFSEQLRDA